MNQITLDDGRSVGVSGRGGRIGAGAWARLLASAVVPDEASSRAGRARELARSGAVHSVTVAPGRITATVVGSTGKEYDVSISATTIPERAWRDVVRASQSRQPLAGGIEGREQSIHLAHLMEADHREPLVPATRRIRSNCTCPDRTEWGMTCKHIGAVAFVIADAIDRDPSLLLRWRGCEPVEPPASRSGDPWCGGPLPSPRPPRSLPAGAVVKRLGRSGIRVGSHDLADALEPAYRAFAALAPSARVQ